MGNIAFCNQMQDRLDRDPETATMELMFPGTSKEIRLSRALMTALDEMSSHKDLSEDVTKAFTELYSYYQWQIDQGYP